MASPTLSTTTQAAIASFFPCLTSAHCGCEFLATKRHQTTALRVVRELEQESSSAKGDAPSSPTEAAAWQFAEDAFGVAQGDERDKFPEPGRS